MVGAVVAELHLHGLRARRQAQQLVAQADAESRHAAGRIIRGSPRWRNRRARDRPGRWRGKPRRASAPARLCRRLRRHHRDLAAALGQHAQDVALDAVIVGHDVNFGSVSLAKPWPRTQVESATHKLSGSSPPWPNPCRRGRESLRALTAPQLHLLCPASGSRFGHLFSRRIRVSLRVSNAGNRRDAVTLEVFAQALLDCANCLPPTVDRGSPGHSQRLWRLLRLPRLVPVLPMCG